MGGERSENRLGHPLSAMQVAPDRISAVDPEVSYSLDRQHSVRPEAFPKGILLPGLPLHLEQRRRADDLPALAPLIFQSEERKLRRSHWQPAGIRAER